MAFYGTKGSSSVLKELSMAGVISYEGTTSQGHFALVTVST